MADMAKKPLENLYLNGDGYATKKELRAALGNTHISGVNPETNAILEVFQVDEINTDSISENVRGRFIYSQNDDAEQRLFLPANSNIIQYPLVGELWLGFTYKGQHFYLSRLSDDNISINYQKTGENQRVSSPLTTNDESVKSNKLDVELKPYGKYFKDLSPITAPYREGETRIQGRFGNLISLGSNQPRSENSPNVKIVADSRSYISLTTDESFGNFTEPQLYLNSDRITLNATNDDIIVSGSNDVNIFGENNISITNNSGDGDIRIGNAKAQKITISSQRQSIISQRQTFINSAEILIGGVRDIPPAVLGNKDFIKVMDLILSTNISSKSIELATEVAQPTPNPITIESLTNEIADLKKIKDERTYLSKKVSIE